MSTPICDFVLRYTQYEPVRFHMPGHKGVPMLGFEPYDITEIDGADELFTASGIIAESEAQAGALFGAHTFYSTGGSTLCIQTMLHLAARYAVSKGQAPCILAGRNAHKAFINAAALLDIDICWLYPENNDSYISCPITAQQVKSSLQNGGKKPVAVYLTSPDYLGNMLDIQAIAEVCHQAGVLLLVDNAHGAYLAFLKENIHPLALGASMCADSAHKTLPVLTGGAYLHIAKKAERFCERAQSALAMYASTSPSYLVLQSLDACNKYLSESDGRRREFVVEYVKSARATLKKKHIVTEGDEPLKIVINAPASGYDGKELAEFFRNAGIEPEFSDSDYTVLMASECNSDRELEILSAAFAALKARAPIIRKMIRSHRCEVGMRIREAVFSPSEMVDAKNAEGRICALPTVSCPPAVPIAVSGEKIDRECVSAFAYYGITQIDVVKNR